jgi:hypothetical protein
VEGGAVTYTIPRHLIESADVIGYHRVRPGRRVVAHTQVNDKPVCFIGTGLGTKREKWEYAATAFDGFLEAVAPGMVRDHNLQGPRPRETVAEFRDRNGYAAVEVNGGPACP